MEKLNHLFRFKGYNIISHQFSRTSKSGEDISLKEFNNDSISGITRRGGLYPLGKVISGYKNQLMLGKGRGMNFTNEIQPPLLERDFNRDRL